MTDDEQHVNGNRILKNGFYTKGANSCVPSGSFVALLVYVAVLTNLTR